MSLSCRRRARVSGVETALCDGLYYKLAGLMRGVPGHRYVERTCFETRHRVYAVSGATVQAPRGGVDRAVQVHPAWPATTRSLMFEHRMTVARGLNLSSTHNRSAARRAAAGRARGAAGRSGRRAVRARTDQPIRPSRFRIVDCPHISSARKTRKVKPLFKMNRLSL